MANYSYDAAEYLSEITDRISISYLATKTDSKGIIRLISKVKRLNGFGHQVIRPILLLVLQLVYIYYCLSQPQLAFYEPYKNLINHCIGGILALHVIMIAIGWS